QQSETSFEKTHKDEQEHVTVARALQKYLMKARLARLPFPIKFPTLNPRPSSTQQSPAATSKILPLICPKTAHRHRPIMAVSNSSAFQKIVKTSQSPPVITVTNESNSSLMDSLKLQPQKFPAAGAAPYIPVRHCNPHNRIAPPVTIRNTIPVFSAPPLPSPQPSLVMRPPVLGMAPPVSVRQAIPVFAAPVRMEELPIVHPAIKVEDPRLSISTTARADEPPVSRAALGRLEDSPIPKVPSVRVEEPLSFKLLPVSITPNSDIPTVQVDPPSSDALTARVESPVCKVTSPPASSKASGEETKIAVQDKLQGPTEIEDFLKDLKI
ncbi:UNVERIFIED_CONTAM: Double-stranded RNA-binding protein 6, partial [Sesamum indicum]